MQTRWNNHSFVFLLLSLLTLVLLASGCATTEAEIVVKTYVVGEEGPAGGFVFYDKGVYSDGWRYLEVAPSSTERPLHWGSVAILSGSDSPILGDGMKNTTQIIASQEGFDDREYAAKYCESLLINGFSDWYLPSKDELDLLYWPLSKLMEEEFMGYGYGYWSSTEYDEKLAWGQGFHAGVQGRIEKSEQFLVRAIRSF